jgi:putative lipoic acid-binding regulatory protein
MSKTIEDIKKNESPKIEFPCAYPIKVVGEHNEDFCECIVAVVQRHDPQLDKSTVKIRESSKGRFASVNITITATGHDQLRALFADLKATGRVSMVL